MRFFRFILRKLKTAARAFGSLISYVHDVAWFLKTRRENKTMGAFYMRPQLADRTPTSHTFDAHYVYMVRWALSFLMQRRPTQHVDVGSLVSFAAMASLVTSVEYLDIRPLEANFTNFVSRAASITNLPYADNSIASLSSLHVVEHVGLGRYGDPLDIHGTEKALKELARVIKPGGVLYLALPIGSAAVYFNAHRVSDPVQVLSWLPGLTLVSFGVVTDAGVYVSSSTPEAYKAEQYACGLYELVKSPIVGGIN